MPRAQAGRKSMSHDFTISDLRQCPELFDTVADRIWQEWWQPNGYPLEYISTRLRENMEATPIPFALVAHDGGKFLGTSSVIASDLEERPQPGMLRFQRHAERRGANPLETVDRDVNDEIDQRNEPEFWRDDQDQDQCNRKVNQAMRQQRQRPALLQVLADRHPGILQHEVGNDVLHGEKQHPSNQRADRDRGRHRWEQQTDALC